MRIASLLMNEEEKRMNLRNKTTMNEFSSFYIIILIPVDDRAKINLNTPPPPHHKIEDNFLIFPAGEYE